MLAQNTQVVGGVDGGVVQWEAGGSCDVAPILHVRLFARIRLVDTLRKSRMLFAFCAALVPPDLFPIAPWVYLASSSPIARQVQPEQSEASAA